MVPNGRKALEVIKLPIHAPSTAVETEFTIPEMEQVREFGYKLHAQGKAWRGDYQGWPAYYTPEDRSRKPANSKQAFYPAEFWIGTDHVWTYTLAWEEGADEEPFELESRYAHLGHP